MASLIEDLTAIEIESLIENEVEQKIYNVLMEVLRDNFLCFEDLTPKELKREILINMKVAIDDQLRRL